jgi:hypothetical protein
MENAIGSTTMSTNVRSFLLTRLSFLCIGARARSRRRAEINRKRACTHSFCLQYWALIPLSTPRAPRLIFHIYYANSLQWVVIASTLGWSQYINPSYLFIPASSLSRTRWGVMGTFWSYMWLMVGLIFLPGCGNNAYRTSGCRYSYPV